LLKKNIGRLGVAEAKVGKQSRQRAKPIIGCNWSLSFRFGDKEAVYRKTTIIPPMKMRIRAIPNHLDKAVARLRPKNKAKKMIEMAITKGVIDMKTISLDAIRNKGKTLINLKGDFQHTYFATTYLWESDGQYGALLVAFKIFYLLSSPDYFKILSVCIKQFMG
jgi:hypothetical protein